MNKIISIEEISNYQIGNLQATQGQNGARLGFSQMISLLGGYSLYDGYKVQTENDTYFVLIDNGQNCCESWGYVQSEDILDRFINSELISVEVTDTALQSSNIEYISHSIDKDQIQFINFNTDNGLFQLAVYNGHNGYYGHGIVFAKNDEIFLQDTL